MSAAVYDFRVSADYVTYDKLIEHLKTLAKSYCFQLEEGEKTGYKHFQGRISLIKKTTQMNAIKLFNLCLNGQNVNYLEPTVKSNRTGNFYCLKIQTRIDGPWTDKDGDIEYIPPEQMELTLKPFQQSIADNKYMSRRQINFVICPHGGSGKTTLALYLSHKKGFVYIPPFDNYEKIMQVSTAKISKDPAGVHSIIIDVPRSAQGDNKKCKEFYTAIETIKGGYSCDLRYHFKEVFFKIPNMWIFMNHKPNMMALSVDRYKLWMLNAKSELVDYEEEVESE